MKTIQTDVLVIGTGFGAAAPALRLAQAGAKVVMIEKGPRVQTADFRQTSDPKYVLKYLKGTPGRSEEHTSELQSRLHLVCRLLLEKKKKDEHHKTNQCGRSLIASPSRQ